MPQIIRIKINKDGTVTVKAEGFWGDECVEHIEKIKEKLGMVLREDSLVGLEQNIKVQS